MEQCALHRNQHNRNRSPHRAHALIHAAYGANQPNKPRDPHDTDPGSCFYQYGTAAGVAQSGGTTRTLPVKHADVLRKAYFSVYAP